MLFYVPKESMVLYTLLPEVFALVALLEVELHDVLVVPLNKQGMKLYFLKETVLDLMEETH